MGQLHFEFNPRKILFISWRNTSRGPAAEKVARTMLEEENEFRGMNIEVSSAGLLKPLSYNILPEMETALKQRYGTWYDANSYRPKEVKPEILELQDYIMCFERYHARKLIEYHPSCFGRVYVPYEDIISPHKKIVEIKGFEAVRSLTPTFLTNSFLRSLYRLSGKVDPKDYYGVIKIYVETLRQIEKYVASALRNLKEGKDPAIRYSL